MKNLINFDDCATTDNYSYFLDYMRDNGKYDICFYKKDTKRKMLECYCPTNREYFEMPYRSGVNSKGITCPNESSCGCVCEFYDANLQTAKSQGCIYKKVICIRVGCCRIGSGIPSACRKAVL